MSCLCLAIISACSVSLKVFSISMIFPSPPSILFFLSSFCLATRPPVPLLNIFVFPLVFSATLADRHAFLKVIASLLVYRVWTTFQKPNSKNLLKLFDDKFWKFHRTPEQADDLESVWNCIFLKLSRLSELWTFSLFRWNWNVITARATRVLR